MLMQDKRAGYTVVEIMVVLAITSALFLSAIILFQGQQGRTQFTDAMRDMQSKMQDWGNDVSSGFYPTSTSGYTCTVTGTPPKAVVTSTPGTLGSNQDCIYIGKVVQFRPNSSTVSAYTIFGNRLDQSDGVSIATSLAAAQPVVAYNSITTPVTDLTETYNLHWGAQAQAIPVSCTTGSTSSCPTYTIALYHSIGSVPTGGASSSLFYMYNLGGTSDFLDPQAVDDCVEAKAASGCSYPTNILSKAQICFKSASSNQFATLVLTPSGDSVNSDLKYVTSC